MQGGRLPPRLARDVKLRPRRHRPWYRIDVDIVHPRGVLHLRADGEPAPHRRVHQEVVLGRRPHPREHGRVHRDVHASVLGRARRQCRRQGVRHEAHRVHAAMLRRRRRPGEVPPDGVAPHPVPHARQMRHDPPVWYPRFLVREQGDVLQPVLRSRPLRLDRDVDHRPRHDRDRVPLPVARHLDVGRALDHRPVQKARGVRVAVRQRHRGRHGLDHRQLTPPRARLPRHRHRPGRKAQ
mmetsp:Transcript_13847/g.35366  ORF Transcript_13847/g.35366 Transcript_13847/m.35366 type:complete len:238 (+) Transcript_13847:600-1313(+)